MKISTSSLYNIQRSYRKISSDGYFGLVYAPSYLEQKDLERVVQKGREYRLRDGFRMDDLTQDPVWVKKLDNNEHDHFPAERFTNGVALSFRKKFNPFSFPKPLGIVYEGNAADVAAFQRTAYVITPYINGTSLRIAFSDLKPAVKEQFFWRLGLSLKYYAEEGLFPLDIAPRDIIYERVQNNQGSHSHIFTFVDPEHLLFVSAEEREKPRAALQEEQKVEFRREYGHFLKKRQLEKAVDIVFGE